MNKTTIAAGTAAAVIAAATTVYLQSDSAAPAEFVDDIKAVSVELPDAAPVAVAPVAVAPVTADDPLPEAPTVATTYSEPGQIKAAAISSVTDDIPRYAALLKEQEHFLTDQRSRIYDPTLGKLDSASWAKWAKIFVDPAVLNYVPEYKPLVPGLKIISELRCPRSADEMATLGKRLVGYRRKKFNAVLVCFETTEDLVQLAAAVDHARSIGMRIIIVYTGGRESLREPVFRDPDTIARFFSVLAPRADAVLTGHWRTSVHLYLPDKAFTNYIIRCAREANPEIGIIGQAYWGQTAATGTEEKDFTTTIALPENSSAVLITGLGYPGAANARALKKLFGAVANHPYKIATVVGEKPYYASRANTGKSHRFNELVKRQLERRLIKAGCQGTLTFSADGSNRHAQLENLCIEPGN